MSCCYYILHFVTAVYFNFFQVSSITSKAIQTRNHMLDGNGDEAQQDQEDESKLSMLSQSLMVIMTSSSVAYFNDETSHKSENLHCWFWSHSNLSVLLVWKFVCISVPQSNKNFVYAQCLRFEKRCEVRDLFKMAFQSFWLPQASFSCSFNYNWSMY